MLRNLIQPSARERLVSSVWSPNKAYDSSTNYTNRCRRPRLGNVLFSPVTSEGSGTRELNRFSANEQ